MIVSVLSDGHSAIHILLLELAMAKFKYVLKFLVIILHFAKILETNLMLFLGVLLI